MNYKPTGDLKKLLDTSKYGRLLPSVELHILAKETPYRDYTHLHPSDLCKDDWCQRAAYFQLTGEPKASSSVSFILQRIFDEGNSIGWKWQKYFSEMGVLYGEWEGFRGVYSRGRADGFPVSSSDYLEVPLVDPYLPIKGRADGWIEGIGESCLIELKSVGVGTLRFEAPDILNMANNDIHKMWKEIKQPFPSHIKQGQIYLALANRMEQAGTLPIPAPKEIVFIYEFKPNQEVKEFVVPYSEGSSARFFSRAERIVKALEEKDPLPCFKGAKGCNQCQVYK